GRKRAFRGDSGPSQQPRMRFIFVRGLSAHTHGNASGIGLADFTTTRLIQAMNYRATVINCVTSGYPEGANLPVHYETDREVLEAALPIIGTQPPEQARIMHVRNTLQVEEVEVSTPCLTGQERATKFETIAEPHALRFDRDGNLPPL